jgi:glucokinase
MSQSAIGIDLGGTRIKGVLIDKTGKLIQQVYTPTNDGDDSVWKNAVAETVKKLRLQTQNSNTPIGISAPGISNNDNTAIAFLPGRLQGLENYVWSDFLMQQTFVLNDAVSALMAEVRLGAAKNKNNVVLLTLGTGVGGAILIDGKPYQGAFHKAGHLGHITMNHEGDQDITGMPGSLEDAIGNATIKKRSLGRFNDTHELLDAYSSGDHFAQWLWLSSVRKLAIGIASITNVLSPECIILAGGITETGNNLFEPLESFLSLYEWRAGGNKTEIIKAQFGDLAGATGAACYAMENSAA